MSPRESFQQNGYYLAKGVFSAEEIAQYREHFEQMRLAGQAPQENIDYTSVQDPLKAYPRIMMPHRRDSLSLDFLCDDRLNVLMTEMTGSEPYAVQTMFYFKPAGARGQALHQDNFYLKAAPSTCMAAWLAVDDCDEENGCLRVVPGSHDIPTMCLSAADTSKSFTDVEVPVPDGMSVESMIMKAGDVLFFNGQLIHGSGPNSSQDRFRRSLIGHYVTGDSNAVSHWYHPVLRMDKTTVEFGTSEGGSQCGEWVEMDGTKGSEWGVKMIEARERDLVSMTE